VHKKIVVLKKNHAKFSETVLNDRKEFVKLMKEIDLEKK
jgi:hypothetical protein